MDIKMSWVYGIGTLDFGPGLSCTLVTWSLIFDCEWEPQFSILQWKNSSSGNHKCASSDQESFIFLQTQEDAEFQWIVSQSDECKDEYLLAAEVPS